MFICLNNIN